MQENIFMPEEIPSACDANLIRMTVEYRRVYSLLIQSKTPTSIEIREQIAVALRAIEQELKARGIDPEVFQVEDLPARPSYHLSGHRTLADNVVHATA